LSQLFVIPRKKVPGKELNEDPCVVDVVVLGCDAVWTGR
jgi:hypothetical protein